MICVGASQGGHRLRRGNRDMPENDPGDERETRGSSAAERIPPAASRAEQLACSRQHCRLRRCSMLWRLPRRRPSPRSTATRSSPLALTLGVLLFAVITAIMLVRTRRAPPRPKPRCATRSSRCAPRSTASTRCCSPSRRSWWPGPPPTTSRTSSATPRSSPSAAAPQRVLAFGTWLEPDKAQAMEHAVDALRADGEGFAMQLTTLAGHADRGRRPRDRRPRRAAAARRQRHQARARRAQRPPRKLAGDMEALRALIDALPSPVWARDDAGELIFVNAAYARAVEAKDAGRRDRARPRAARPHARATSRAAAAPPASLSPARAAGDRRRQPPHLRRARRADPRAAPASASTRPKPRRCAPSSARWSTRTAARSTSSPTGVAIFGADQQLDVLQRRLSARCGTSTPASSTRPRPIPRVLDRLRAARKLPEEQDFRAVEGRAARGLSRDRGQGAPVAPARRPHAARRHHAQSGRRRHLSVRRRHRAARSEAPLRRADPRAGRDARQPRRRRRGVRQRRPAAAAQSGVRADVEARSRSARRASAHRGGDRAGAARLHGDEALWRQLRAAVTAIDDREPLDRAASSAATAA